VRAAWEWRSCIALALLCGAAAARAGLGGTVAELNNDAALLQARTLAAPLALRSAAGASFSRHQITLAGGGSAVEFADANGRVFAVAWSAPVMPDLAVLLGSYKADLDAAQQQPAGPRSLHQLRAHSGDWVLVSSGHLRGFHGYSYLRSGLPPGFDLGQLAQ
jgi:hypothetical protein